MRLIVRAEAEAELVEAIDWYEARDAGLESDFLRCIDSCFERILRHPESYSVVHRKTRMAIVRRFPYLVMYRVSGDTISIIAIFHASRDPMIWKER